LSWISGKFVATVFNKFAGGPVTAYGSSDQVWTSPDGVEWSQADLSGNPKLETSGSTARAFIVSGSSEQTKLPTVWTSNDGVNWTYESLGKVSGTAIATEAYGRAVAVVGTQPASFWWRTSDGTWSQATIRGAAPPAQETVTACLPNGCIAFGQTSGEFWTSSNGAVWHDHETIRS